MIENLKKEKEELRNKLDQFALRVIEALGWESWSINLEEMEDIIKYNCLDTLENILDRFEFYYTGKEKCEYYNYQGLFEKYKDNDDVRNLFIKYKNKIGLKE